MTLIADDNREWQQILTEILQVKFSCIVVVAHGNQVLRTALALRPDVITLDVSMTGISGLKLLPELRVQLPHSIIIVVTTHSSKHYVQEAFRRGANGYVMKGRALGDLIPTIKIAMNSTRQRGHNT